MNATKEKKRIHTPMFRVSYQHIFQPQKNKNTGKNVYSITMIFDPEQQQEKEFQDMLRLEMETGRAKWPNYPEGLFKRPFRKGTQVSANNPLGYDLVKNPEYKDKIIVAARSTERPVGLVYSNKQPILDRGDFYSGCYAIASITAYTYDTDGNRGVSFGLTNVMKIKDGDALVAMANPEDDFAEVDLSKYGGVDLLAGLDEPEGAAPIFEI